jgi:DNA-binding beta-propeller fold protein YncE
MKRSITNYTKHNKKQKLSTKCKIIDTIDIIKRPRGIIQTPCGKFLIGIEGHSIYCYNLKTKQKFRIAGSVDEHGHQDGTRDESRFDSPYGLTLSKDLKTLFVADALNQVIRSICVGTGITKTFAGQVQNRMYIDGPKEKACFEYLISLKLSPDGNTLIVSDDSKLRKICIATGQVDTIHTFELDIRDFTLSPDGKHVIICHLNKVLKYNLETGKSEIILEVQGFESVGCELSKDGQLLFIANMWIKVVNFVTNEVIDNINTPFKCYGITNSTNYKQLYNIGFNNDKIIIHDISKYYTNFKTFLQSQLFKQSFLSRSLIKRFN